MESSNHLTPIWSFQIVDIGGPWCWTVLDDAAIERVFNKLRHLESMTWNDITVKAKKTNHSIPRGDIIKLARDRLEEIGQADIDELVSFHVTGRKRIWGIRDRHILRLLWWDPEHKICPSEKK